MLALGLLLFTWTLWTKRVPGGWVRVVALGFMAFYLVLFSALLVPQTRVYAITMTGQADKLKAITPGARIFTVTPAKVTKGASVDVVLIGANFGAAGSAAPKVVLAGQEVAPQAWSDTQIAVQFTGALASLDGPQSIAVKTSDGKVSTPAIVTFAAPAPPPQITSWRLVPSGRAYDYRLFGPVALSCLATGPVPATFDRQVNVDPGWELATDAAHQGTLSNTPGSAPTPPLGFSESGPSTSGNGVINRVIQYLPSADATVKTGIRVAGTCLTPLFGGGGQFRWSAAYNVWGRKLFAKDGFPVTGGVCVAQGLHTCGTYPADKLAMFKDGRPDSYTLMATIRTSNGQAVDRTATFTPGNPAQKLTVDNVAIWMENNSLLIKGPGTYRPPINVILPPFKPVPLKPLPIFHP